VRTLAAELVRPLSRLRAVILQASANPDEVAVFLFENGQLRGPTGFSTLGMKIQNEQSGSTSLFAQPMAVEAVPEEQGAREQGSKQVAEPSSKIPRGMLEARLEAALAELAVPTGATPSTIRQAHLALLKRWYYRPEAKRAGEIFFPDDEEHWPIKAIIRGVGRVAAKAIAPGTPA
jgi:excinuclease ABC subunit C